METRFENGPSAGERATKRLTGASAASGSRVPFPVWGYPLTRRAGRVRHKADAGAPGQLRSIRSTDVPKRYRAEQRGVRGGRALRRRSTSWTGATS